MRALVVIVVLVLGLAAGLATALVFEGRMSHLRAVSGDALPAWTGVIAPSAGLLGGDTAALPGAAAVSARWQFERFARDGLVPVPVWHLRLEGEGLVLEGEMRLARTEGAGGGAELRLSDLRGRVDAARLPIWAEAPALGGRFDVIRGQAAINLLGGRLTRFSAEGRAVELDHETGPAGEGRFSARRADDGNWHVSADLGGADDARRLDLVFDLQTRMLELVLTGADGAERRESVALAAPGDGG